mmetsp:Transcript_56499/g.132521  ORF Transcript_56499/g.132521 Transcript_56499/m.132521 type:complete len:211 (-) Transcript_56499:241-873(-)
MAWRYTSISFPREKSTKYALKTFVIGGRGRSDSALWNFITARCKFSLSSLRILAVSAWRNSPSGLTLPHRAAGSKASALLTPLRSLATKSSASLDIHNRNAGQTLVTMSTLLTASSFPFIFCGCVRSCCTKLARASVLGSARGPSRETSLVSFWQGCVIHCTGKCISSCITRVAFKALASFGTKKVGNDMLLPGGFRMTAARSHGFRNAS